MLLWMEFFFFSGLLFPRLGVELELWLLAYITVTATVMQHPSHVFDLYHSSWQRGILNPLIEARNWIHILRDTSWIHFHWAMMGMPRIIFLTPIFCLLGFCFFRATIPARGSSHARGQLEVAAASLHHSPRNAGSEPQVWQCQILNPLSEAKHWTHILMDTIWVCNPLSHKGNSINFWLCITMYIKYNWSVSFKLWVCPQ